MSATRLAARYAKALMGLAIEQNQVEEVTADIRTLKQFIDGSPELRMLLHSPIIQPGKKQPILNKALAGAFKSSLPQFIDVLLRKHREMYLPDIVTAFLEQYNKAKRIEEVKITTAVPVEENLLKQISDSLHQEGDLAIELETTVDPDIIGGYVIQYGGLLYDASVARNLRRLRKAFDDNEYVRKF